MRIITTTTTTELLIHSFVVVACQPDGEVKLNRAQELGFVGVGWRLDPGPTHLDTCYIVVDAPKGSFSSSSFSPNTKAAAESDGDVDVDDDVSASDDKPSGSSGGFGVGGDREILTFMGYIDRGQRLESRFSKRPIRMSGLVGTSDPATAVFKGSGGSSRGSQSNTDTAALRVAAKKERKRRQRGQGEEEVEEVSEEVGGGVDNKDAPVSMALPLPSEMVRASRFVMDKTSTPTV